MSHCLKDIKGSMKSQGLLFKNIDLYVLIHKKA